MESEGLLHIKRSPLIPIVSQINPQHASQSHLILFSYIGLGFLSCLFPSGLNLLTYLLTPWSRVILERLSGFQPAKKFPVFYGTRRSITAFTNARHLSIS